MKLAELVRAISALLPEAEILEDADRQLVIYTGRWEKPGGELVPFEEDCGGFQHSACRQYYIDSGTRACVQEEEEALAKQRLDTMERDQARRSGGEPG